MSKELTTTRARSNYEYCRETIELKVGIEVGFIDLGKRLYNIKEKELFLPNYDSFGEFTEEMKMTPTAVSKLIGIYEKFILMYGFSDKEVAEVRSWQNLAETLAYVTDKKSAKKWLDNATNMRRTDLRDELAELITGVNQVACDHKNSILLKICKDCKVRIVTDETDAT